MNTLKSSLLFLLGMILIVFSFYRVLESPAPGRYQVLESSFRAEGILRFDEKEIVVEIADRSDEIVRGLSGRSGLKKGTGMLFVFDQPGRYGFWMKGMNFPIDMVWIDRDFRVVTVKEGIIPETYPAVFYPAADALMVLELASGDATGLGIEVGTKMNFLSE